MVSYDVGEVTDGSIMPVTELSFGGQVTSTAKATATLTNVRCGPPGETFGNYSMSESTFVFIFSSSRSPIGRCPVVISLYAPMHTDISPICRLPLLAC